ncbi:MAG: glycosyltransferase family 39 protein [Candidatus Omnitrophica bacterium]|nr:glycosyltransferase family 39 protein [Candidatus Omnitrophota bacterium]
MPIISQLIAKISRGYSGLICVLGVGAMLRFFRLDVKSVWFDEAQTLLQAEQGLKSIFTTFSVGTHPPLYRLLMYWWKHLGSSDAFLRIPSVVFSIISIWLLYKLAELIFSKKIALLGAFFIAVSPFQIHYAQEIRMYSLLLLLSLGSIYFFQVFLKTRDGRILGITVFVTALSLYTHYFAFLIILSHNVFLFFNWRRYKELIPSWLSAQGILILLFIPWGAKFFAHLGSIRNDFWIPPVSIQRLIEVFEQFLFGYYTANINGWLLLLITAGGLLWAILFYPIVSGKTGQDDSFSQRSFIASYLWAPLALIIIFSYSAKPILLTRTLIALSPCYYLVLVLGWERLFKYKYLAVLMGALFLSVTVLTLGNYYDEKNFRRTVSVFPRKPLRQIARSIVSRYKEGDIIVLSTQNIWPSFQYYFPQRLRQYIYLIIDPADFPDDGSFSALQGTYGFEIADIHRIASSARGAWVVCSHWEGVPYLSSQLREWLREQEIVFQDKKIPGVETYYCRIKER